MGRHKREVIACLSSQMQCKLIVILYRIYGKINLIWFDSKSQLKTGATRCLTPIVLYTKVDVQCDKLATDNRCQFITLSVHLGSQHL